MGGGVVRPLRSPLATGLVEPFVQDCDPDQLSWAELVAAAMTICSFKSCTVINNVLNCILPDKRKRTYET